jgi:hypothetical protein
LRGDDSIDRPRVRRGLLLGHTLALAGYQGVAAAFLDASAAVGAREVIDRLAAQVSAFRGARPQDEDITFLVVRISEVRAMTMNLDKSETATSAVAVSY